MTGTYRANAQNPAALAKLAEIRRLLDRDGIKYEVEITEIVVTVRAIGTVVPRPRRTVRPRIVPPELTLEQCEKRFKEANEAFEYAMRSQADDMEELRANSEHWSEMVRLASTRKQKRAVKTVVWGL